MVILDKNCCTATTEWYHQRSEVVFFLSQQWSRAEAHCLTPSQWRFWKPQNVSLPWLSSRHEAKNLRSVATHADDDLNDGLNGFYTPKRSLTLYKRKTRGASQTCFDSAGQTMQKVRFVLLQCIKSWMKCSFAIILSCKARAEITAWNMLRNTSRNSNESATFYTSQICFADNFCTSTHISWDRLLLPMILCTHFYYVPDIFQRRFAWCL